MFLKLVFESFNKLIRLKHRFIPKRIKCTVYVGESSNHAFSQFVQYTDSFRKKKNTIVCSLPCRLEGLLLLWLCLEVFLELKCVYNVNYTVFISFIELLKAL